MVAVLASEAGATLDLSTILNNVGTGVSGIFDNIVVHGLNVIVTNPVAFLMLCLSFAGAALGFAGRIFRTARK